MKIIERLLSVFLCFCILTLLGNFALKEFGVITVSDVGSTKEIYYKDSYVYKEVKILKLKISGSEKAVLMLNGEIADYIVDESGYFNVNVSDGDVLGIDARDVEDEEVTIFISDSSNEIVYPKEGTKVFVNKGIINLFTIRLNKN